MLVIFRTASAAFLGLCLAGPAIAADGYFLQSDIGRRTQSLVATATYSKLSYGFNFSKYDGGYSAAISATYALGLADIAVMKLGPTVGVAHEDGEDDDYQAGLKLGLERYTPTSFGSTYVLLDASSVDNSWFLLGQMNFTKGDFGIELSRGGSDNYHETSLALQKRLSDGPVSLRLGYKLTSDEIFAGITINTF